MILCRCRLVDSEGSVANLKASPLNVSLCVVTSSPPSSIAAASPDPLLGVPTDTIAHINIKGADPAGEGGGWRDGG